MNRSDICKIGFLSTSEENWKAVQDILTQLWDQAYSEPEPLKPEPKHDSKKWKR